MKHDELLQSAQDYAAHVLAERERNAKVKQPHLYREVLITLLDAACTNAQIFAFFHKQKITLQRASTIALLKQLRAERKAQLQRSSSISSEELHGEGVSDE